MKEEEAIEEINFFDEKPMHSNGFTLGLGKEGVLINFRMSTLQITDDSEKIKTTNYKVIILKPEMVKALSEGLKENIKILEKKHGKIKNPKFETNDKGTITTKEDNYIG